MKFELKYTAYVDSLESTKSLRNGLEEQMEKQADTVTNLSQNWLGLTSEMERNRMTTSLTVGSYAKAYAYTSELVRIMEEYQLPITQNMARREQLGEQLHQDNYVEPDLTCHTEDDLYVDYAMLEITKTNCESARESGNSAADVVEEMIDEALAIAAEYLDFGDARELLSRGRTKINRLGNYVIALDSLKQNMLDMEYNMNFDMYAVIKAQGDTELEFEKFNPKEIKSHHKIEKPGRLIEPNEVSKVLNQDEWTEEDAIYIAAAWDFYLEQRDEEMITTIVKAIYECDVENNVLLTFTDDLLNNRKLSKLERIRIYSEKWNIDIGKNKWTIPDVINFSLGKDGLEFLFYEKLNFVELYNEVIIDVAEKNDIPPLLLAGIVFNEYGGDPMIIDDLAYDFRSFVYFGPDWLDKKLDVRKPELTSFGNVSIQVRRAIETLEYNQDNMSQKDYKDVIKALKDPVMNIYIVASHVSDLKQIDYSDIPSSELTKDQIIVIGTRYNRGPDMPIEDIMKNTEYGDSIIANEVYLLERLGK